MAGNSKSSVVLQERDLRLLETLESMRVVNREQAKVVGGFRSTRRANDRLLLLTRAGFLKRAFLGSREAVYWRADRPQNGRKANLEGGTVEPAALFLRHRLEINRLRLLVEYSGLPSRDWWFGSWRSFDKPISATMPLIPDGYFELSSRAGSRAIFVEVDLGTEAVPILARKARLYLQLATSGEFQQLFNRTQFRVLLITTSLRRLEHIRAAIANVTDKIFWLGTLDLVAPDRFWTNSWHRPTGDQLQTIL